MREIKQSAPTYGARCFTSSCQRKRFIWARDCMVLL